ncbi:LemA family protein [Kineosporia sp. NBRC 101731]|uniref:LemA family protein n=1 Tax=Kineosporia sp. NBRC 101731 TaxID=3032199 RepID=UPI0024A0A855|nr:LemA family protein [Kineosporia sp. NBRC 101731]GLY27110.1 LemA family protein [Kineosporia sp. NBRC 101731]
MLIALVVVVVLLGGLALGLGYNGLVRRRNQVQETWRQIEVELTRRHDLVPNLVEAVRGDASSEREPLDAVLRARDNAATPGASVAEQAEHEGQLSQALGRLLAVAGACPGLTANENFLSLQNELVSTEDRIAAGRRSYNAHVRDLNTRVESVPTNIVAGAFGFERADYFEAENGHVAAPIKPSEPGKPIS